MSASLLIANLLRVAKEDLEGARLLASAGNRNAIYLCEQAAEKLIRAILTSEKKHAGIKHQLDAMVDLVPDDNPLKPGLREIEELAAFATSYRYPTATGRVVQAPRGAAFEAKAARVELVLREAAVRFGVDLDKPDVAATNPDPIR